MKNIIVTVVLTLVIAATISALSIVSYKALTSDSEPDIVVGVTARCEIYVTSDTIIETTGSECEQGNKVVHSSPTTSYSIRNSRRQVIVRTSKGSTYQIDVPITTKVAVGDTWPK
jgi:hypothetical protein